MEKGNKVSEAGGLLVCNGRGVEAAGGARADDEHR